MMDAFSLLDPQGAHLYLQRLPASARRKGEQLFRMGRVQEIVVVKPGADFSTQVLDEKQYQVNLRFDVINGWEAECTCPEEFDCKHVFAAMNSLIAENRAATVRNLSSNTRQAAAAVAASRWKQGKEPANELVLRLAIAVGRNPLPEELKYISKVHRVYERCQKNQRITGWEFQELGFRNKGYSWDPLHIWPVFPENLYEFWLYVANAAREQGLSIPDFMLPVTDLSLIQQRIAKWRRSQEIQNWKYKLDNSQYYSKFPGTSTREIDMRLVIAEQEPRLQRREVGQEEFEYLRPSGFRNFAGDLEEGIVHLTSEGELIWHFFYHLLIHGGSRIRYVLFEEQTLRMFGRLLRTRQLDSRIVNLQGQPLARPAEPLRWQLQQVEVEDYNLRLVKADGSPVPPFLCVLPGQPALYLSQEALYVGPPDESDIVDPSADNPIPGPALETSAGVEFLRSIGVELPPRIQERLHLLPFQVAIDCQLRPLYPESNVEECLVSVLAEAADGHQETWTGSGWSDNSRKPRGHRRSGIGSITVYDRTGLEGIPALLEPLNLRNSNYGQGLALRVTKKFPELFAQWLKSVPPTVIVRLQGELASLAGGDVAGKVTLTATETAIDWFDLRVVLDVSDTTLSAKEVKALLHAKGGYVRLEGKGWRRLHYDLSEEENESLAKLGLSARELTDEPQRLHALQLSDEAAKKFLPEEQVVQIHRRSSELKTRVAPALPTGVIAELRPYQLEGFHFLAYLATNRFGGILADDMGLGKTLQTLAWLLWLRDNSSTKLPALVVCPKSVMDNWKSETQRFTPRLSVKLWPAVELGKFCQELSSAHVHVINYNQLRLLGESLKATRWLAVILDEGQYIKNPNSQTAQIARDLSAEHRLILSGTPIENRLLDLWSLMGFAMPGVLGSRAQFARIHDPQGDPFARRRLAARVRPFVLRRTKSQVAKDLPDRIEEDLFCEIEGEQQILYRAELKRAQQLLLGIKTQKELASQQFHFLTSLLRLRQICCDPRLVKADSPAGGAKTEALLDVLEPVMEEGQKVLVFSQFVQMLDLIRPVLAEKNWPLFWLTGETENRGALVQEFQDTKGPAVFLISLKAGGFGLNLTAASYVVLFDPWWNPAVENQAIDRTHRIGQTNKVIAYRLLIKNSIEEKIRELQKQKKALAQDVLGEEKFSQSLTLEDLHFLFAD
jgi:hypothetical protein